MELEEEEAQICRLCGHSENIYIDVFGEEGLKRLLGLKIHTKINILVKKNDGLPQKVCLRCLGTLEFLCDFYELCHATQKDLREACQSPVEAVVQQESDAESDKENVLPAASDAKRKTKVSNPGGSNNTKNCLIENNSSYCKYQKKDEIGVYQENSNNSIHTPSVERDQSPTQTIVQLNNYISKNESIQNSTISHEIKSESNQIGILKCEKSTHEKEGITNKQPICTVVLGRTRNSANSMRKNTNETEEIITANLNQPLRCKRGRKRNSEKLADSNQSSNSVTTKIKMEKGLKEKKIENFSDSSKRRCLRTVSANDKSDMIGATTVSYKAQKGRSFVGCEQVPVKSHLPSDRNIAFPKSSKTEINDKLMKNTEDTANKVEQLSATNKSVSVIVKQENETKDIPTRSAERLNHFVWIPSDNILLENIEKSKPRNEQVIMHASPPPGDEAETNKSSDGSRKVEDSGISACTSSNDLGTVMYPEQNRLTVITKSSQQSGVTASETIDYHCAELNDIEDEMDQSTRDSLDSAYTERSLSRQSSRDSSISGNRSKDGKYGKISELISDAQKREIETYYSVDMSIVNSKEVQQHLTVIDKKNIRCNICKTLYLRMDKCQVHIWGHLEMKPYQCKACNFATVTVSNVRCHIRKSHLKLKPFACHLCDKRYVTAVLLDEHLNTHTGARPFKCKICDFASASRQMLSYHNTTHKPIKDISCKVCGKEFYSRGRLRAHMLIHNKDKVVKCKLCSAYLSSEEALKMHHENIHMRDYVCNVCGKRLKSRKALHNHQNVHAAAKYKCSICPNVYKSSQILKEHLLKHEGIRKYKCQTCEKSFGQQSHLAAHMAVHSKVRFHCPGCDKAFNRHDNMKIHAKRCKLLLDNPHLMELLTKKEKSKSSNKMKKIAIVTENTVLCAKNRHLETPIKTVIDSEKIDNNLCQVRPYVSCVSDTNKSWNRNLVDNTVLITSSAEIDVIPITNIDDVSIPDTEGPAVCENILGPESF